jgi:dolichol-phosphate mannosyltransferase
MIQSRKKIGICCPTFNEEENIRDFYNSYKKIGNEIRKNYKIEFLFADNCSTDKSFQIIKDIAASDDAVFAIKYSKNFGVMKSIYTAIIKSPNDWDSLAVFDCDIQDPPSLIKLLLNEQIKGYRIVYGSRKDRDESKLISILRNFYVKLEGLLYSKINKPESGAFLIDKRVIQEIKKQNYYKEHIPTLIADLGFTSSSIPYSRLQRKKGVTKFNLISYISYAIDGIMGSSIVPLRISIIVSIFFGFLSIALSIYFIIAKFILGIDFQEGIAALIVLLLLNFSINFFFLGVIGEYIGRTFKKEEISMPAIIDETISLED